MKDQKALAYLAVKAAADACRADPESFRKGAYLDSMKAIEDAESYFIKAIEGSPIEVPNEAYRKFDLAVTKLVLLSVEYPELYHSLMVNVCHGKPFSSYAGFIATHWFFRLLSDDHDFVLVEDADKAVIEISDGHLVGPASLHSFLSKII